MVVFKGGQITNMLVDKIKPNPFRDVINIKLALQQPQQLTIQLVDMTGRVELSSNYAGKAGVNKIVLNNLGNLSAGVYFIKIITADTLEQQKLLKIK